MRLVKTDRRHAGYSSWKYYVFLDDYRPVKERIEIFCAWREWCWKVWGASKELTMYSHQDLFDGIHGSNPHWCWLSNEDGRRRIYLHTEQEVSLFTLKWS